MNILLLGVGGFIGSHLAGYLIERGEHAITGVDMVDTKIAHLDAASYRFIRADVRHNREMVDELIAGTDVVVDLIAHANPSMYINSPVEVVQLNFFENVKVAELCMKHSKRLIQYSTSEVYGHPSGDRYSEDDSRLVLGPVHKQRWIYSSAKQLLERLIHAHGRQGDLDYTIIRPFNFVGPRFDYLVPAGSMGGPRLFAHYMSALLTGGPMYLVDGGHRHRSFTHIADANTAFQTLLDHIDAHGETFNVGNPEINVTVRDVAHLMQRLYEAMTGEAPRSELIEVDGETFYGEGYEDVDRVPPDIEKIRNLGWLPVHGLEATFHDAMVGYVEAAGSTMSSGIARAARRRS